MSSNILPVSAIVPTRNRAEVFLRTLQSLSEQSFQPIEMIVVDASSNTDTEKICTQNIAHLATKINYYRAEKTGAAIQRNQAFRYASQPYILFMDDDILFEPECIAKLWTAINSDPHIGGACSLITNCHYEPPGRLSRLLFRFLNGQAESSYAGKCLGPALNLLPEDKDDLPEIVPVEWMNTTCTLYRKEAMPNPPFPDNFVGYSLMEDVTISLTVGKKWQLVNARTAKIFHDSQPGDHKSSVKVLAQMDMVNRYYVMTKVLERRSLQYHLKFLVLQLFTIASLFGSQGKISDLPATVLGKILGIFEIIKQSSRNSQTNVDAI